MVCRWHVMSLLNPNQHYWSEAPQWTGRHSPFHPAALLQLPPDLQLSPWKNLTHPLAVIVLVCVFPRCCHFPVQGTYRMTDRPLKLNTQTQAFTHKQRLALLMGEPAIFWWKCSGSADISLLAQIITVPQHISDCVCFSVFVCIGLRVFRVVDRLDFFMAKLNIGKFFPQTFIIFKSN